MTKNSIKYDDCLWNLVHILDKTILGLLVDVTTPQWIQWITPTSIQTQLGRFRWCSRWVFKEFLFVRSLISHWKKGENLFMAHSRVERRTKNSRPSQKLLTQVHFWPWKSMTNVECASCFVCGRFPCVWNRLCLYLLLGWGDYRKKSEIRCYDDKLAKKCFSQRKHFNLINWKNSFVVSVTLTFSLPAISLSLHHN